MKNYLVFAIVSLFFLVSAIAGQTSVKPTPTPADPYALTPDDLKTAYKASDSGKPVFDIGEGLGDDEMKAGEYAKAIVSYSSTIVMFPKYAAAYLKRGDAYRANKNSRLALADYQKALELDPKNEQAKARISLAKFTPIHDKPDPEKVKTSDLLNSEKKSKEFLDALDAVVSDPNFKGKYPEAMLPVPTPEERRKLYIQYSTEFNAQNKIYAEKVNALARVQNQASPDKAARCVTLLEVESTLLPMDAALRKLEGFYKNSEAVKVLQPEEFKQLKYIVEDWQNNVFYNTKYQVATSIGVFDCKEDLGKKKVTIDDMMEQAGKEIQAERQGQIIEQLKLLGDMKPYFMAGQKFNSLTSGSAPADICRATLDYKHESDAIEPILDKIDQINLDGYPVKFENPEAAKRLEMTLKFHSQLFSTKKAAIRDTAARYSCK